MAANYKEEWICKLSNVRAENEFDNIERLNNESQGRQSKTSWYLYSEVIGVLGLE